MSNQLIGNLNKAQQLLDELDKAPSRGDLRLLSQASRSAFLKFLTLGFDLSPLRDWNKKRLASFIQRITELEEFYQGIGGIQGYQNLAQTLLNSPEKEAVRISVPPIAPIEQEDPELLNLGIDAQAHLAEIYPIGGAADRLNHHRENEDGEFPAATLKFFEFTLFERLIRDLEAREELYFQKHGKRIETPIVIMTSDIRYNHSEIMKLCQEKSWFGRSPKSIKFVRQPLVPTFDRKGNWHLTQSERTLFKPGGHGVIWHLLKQEKVFAFLKERGVSHALVRQINNPIAAVDHGLISFLGLGMKKKAHFGFASCAPRVGISEGRNVLLEDGRISNIEYCEWRNSCDEDEDKYLANTNILFVQLEAIENALEKMHFPGLLINFKKIRALDVARVESTMQNIVEAIEPEKIFLTKLKRRKTISPIKHLFSPKLNKILETPEGCIFDFLSNAQELLNRFCVIETPPLPKFEEFLSEGAPYYFSYHPSLGPAYTEIQKKVYGGRIGKGVAIHIEATNVELKNTTFNGHLHILAKTKNHRCVFHDVDILGREEKSFDPTKLWKEAFPLKGALRIILEEGSEFIAEGIMFDGPFTIEVKPKTRLIARNTYGMLTFLEQKIG